MKMSKKDKHFTPPEVNMDNNTGNTVGNKVNQVTEALYHAVIGGADKIGKEKQAELEPIQSEDEVDNFIVYRVDGDEFKSALSYDKNLKTVLIKSLGDGKSEYNVNLLIKASKADFEQANGNQEVKICNGLAMRVMVENTGDLFESNTVTLIFNHDRVTFPEDCSNLFSGLRADEVRFSGCDFSAVRSLEQAFSKASVQRLYLNNWNTRNLWNVSNMFYLARIGAIYMDGMDLSEVRDARGMFRWCETGIIELDKMSFNKRNLKSIVEIFAGTRAKQINCGKLGGRLVFFADRMFDRCSAGVTGGKMVQLRLLLTNSNFGDLHKELK